MTPPFTKEAFLEIFTRYNLAVFPAQYFLYLPAFISILLLLRKKGPDNMVISGALALLWLWAGIGYHWLFFSSINKAAYLFGGLFVLQGILFLVAGRKKKLDFGFRKNWGGFIGSLFIVYAILIYPILGDALGHVYPAKPTFGLPCPLVIFTFGMLLHTNGKVPAYLLLIPGFWAVVGFSAVLFFGITEDMMLLISAVAGILLTVYRKRS